MDAFMIFGFVLVIASALLVHAGVKVVPQGRNWYGGKIGGE